MSKQTFRNKKPGRLRKFLDYWQLTTEPDIEASKCIHRRRFLKPYQRRLKLLRDAWLYLLSALLVLQLSVPFILVTCMFSTFLSFTFLDETPFVRHDE